MVATTGTVGVAVSVPRRTPKPSAEPSSTWKIGFPDEDDGVTAIPSMGPESSYLFDCTLRPRFDDKIALKTGALAGEDLSKLCSRPNPSCHHTAGCSGG